MKFLSAEWKHLLLANYSVDPDLLAPFVPDKTRLDAFEGHTYVSLVAFYFDNTRVLGIPVPFHRRFEEVNLRFYVTPEKDPSIRAVTFIKEIVPKSVIPLVANSLFNENYVSMPMDHENGTDHHWYSWGRDENRFGARIDQDLTYPEPGSVGEFITEHYWGYTKGTGRTLEYQVEHPPWKGCAVTDFQIDVDFGATYGEEFSFLSQEQPHNVQYAHGSAVTVSSPSRL